jgi:nucleoside-diphosphate-sugar epimerase
VQIQKIVITGATSMIGAVLAKCAVDNGIKVLCIVRKDSSRLCNIPRSDLIKIVYCNITDYCKLNLKESFDIFYHFAWENTAGASRDVVDVQVKNIQYTLDAVRLANRLGCRKFIGAGSQAEYGIVAEPLKSDTSVNPKSCYGIAKYTAGKFSSLLCSQLNIQFNWVRLLSVYGSLDGAHSLIMYAIHELQAGRTPELTKCEQIWDYLYCDDAANAMLSIAKNGVDGKTYPLGSGYGIILSGYIKIIRDIISPNSSLQFGKKEYYPHQPMYLCADITELTNDTGWKPEITFEEGIKKIIENISS